MTVRWTERKTPEDSPTLLEHPTGYPLRNPKLFDGLQAPEALRSLSRRMQRVASNLLSGLYLESKLPVLLLFRE